MARQSQCQRIRRLARAFVRARERFATLVAVDATPGASLEQCDAACEEMFTLRTELVDAVLAAVGHGLDEGPAIVEVGRLIVAVGESPEDEGLGVQTHDPAVVVYRVDQVIRLGWGVARA
jgi:hypothetical protein